MKTLHLFKLFFNLGLHIGSQSDQLKPVNSFFLLGRRRSYFIINVQMSIFFLKKAISFIYNLGRANSHLLFYFTQSSIINEHCITLFISHLYNKNHSFLYSRWVPGCLSNFYMQAIEKLKDIVPLKKKEKQFNNFIHFFFKLLFFSLEFKNSNYTWQNHFSSIKKYWRFLTLYSFYKNFNTLPDALVLVTADEMNLPARECTYLKIPVVGPVDTYSNINLYTYGIPSNSSNFVIACFYFFIFTSSFKKGELSAFLNV